MLVGAFNGIMDLCLTTRMSITARLQCWFRIPALRNSYGAEMAYTVRGVLVGCRW